MLNEFKQMENELIANAIRAQNLGKFGEVQNRLSVYILPLRMIAKVCNYGHMPKQFWSD